MRIPRAFFVHTAIVFAILVVMGGCKKDRCKAIEIERGVCSFNDTVLSYSLLAGKWYLKTYEVAAPHSETQLSCYSDQENYLEFLPNRTVFVHGTALRTRDTIMECELFPD